MKGLRYAIWLILLGEVLMACTGKQASVGGKMAQADVQLEQLALCLQQSHPIDSIVEITTREEGIYFYIYNENRLIFWSDNRLNLSGIAHPTNAEWQLTRFANASGWSKWKSVGVLGVWVVVPTEWNEVDPDILSESFSYRPLMTHRKAEQTFWQQAKQRVRVFYFVSLLLFVSLFGFGIGWLIHKRGFRNMGLQSKLQYLFVLTILVSLIYIFAMSVSYVRRRYARQQQQLLQDKCRYIRTSLQYLYYWDVRLDSSKTEALNIDLRDIAYTYGVDIHAYDLQGQLVGSSTPQLFEDGLLSTCIAPAVFSAEGHTCTRYEYLSQVRYLASYTEFVNGAGLPIGYIGVPSFLSEDEMDLEVDRFLARLLPAYLIALFLAFILSSYISSLLVKPIRRIAQNMQQFRLGKHARRIEYAYHDEVGELVQRYNEMVEEVENASRRLIRSEREGAWRTMARQVAHEINNSLTPMKLTLQQLQRAKGTERFETYFDKSARMLIEQIDNMSHIATSFSSFAKMPEVSVSEVDVADKLTRVIELMSANEQHIPIRYVGPNEGVMAWADKEQIQLVFTNILRNALQALDGRTDGDVIVMLKQEDGQVVISFSDNAGGIPEEIQDRIFVPNFTTKSYGTGLGLAISRNIVESCDGSIRFETGQKGTTFFITLKQSLNNR
ncbi:MAG: HAMP domain-containing histidine kinase [Paludibacteraceae bacterium]|nr:HAMP domain-containing histidine kinase [Paludibacteraceae bacterium]